MRKNKKDNYISKGKLKKKLNNSQVITNIKEVEENGTILLKDNKYAYLLELAPIDLSLTSNQERKNFFTNLRLLYQISGVIMDFYKIDKNINLNINKDNYKKLIENTEDKVKKDILEESKLVLEQLEDDGYTTTSIYYLVLIADSKEKLEKKYDELLSISNDLNIKIKFSLITNRLEIYQFLSNIYYSKINLDQLIWLDYKDLICPVYLEEKVSSLKIDEETIQMVTIKDITPFIEDQFLEKIFNIPGIKVSIKIKDTLSQEELIKWINSEYQFLLADKFTTRKLSDSEELDIKQQNYQQLMSDIKNGDEKIKEVSIIIAISGSKEEREFLLEEIKRLAKDYLIKVDIPRLRQMECWQAYDLTDKTINDYSIYLPSLTMSSSFPFTKSYFNDDKGYLIGADNHTDLPVFFDPYVISNSRTSHNIAVISSTGGGKSFTLKKMIVNEFARGTKIFIFDAENEYHKLINNCHGEYIDLYSKKGGIINPLQIRYLPNEDNDNMKETDCPLAKHLGFLESFFKCAFDSITEKEIIILLDVIENLYKRFNIYKNTSINTLQTLKPTDYPKFSNLYDYLKIYKKETSSVEKIKVLEQLDILISRFLTGTDAYLFDGFTNINLNNNIIGFNLQELLAIDNKRLLNTQILNLLSFLNNNIISNKIINEKNKVKQNIMVVADEFHIFIDEKNCEILKSFSQMARRLRKYSGSLVVSTQSIKDFIGNAEILRNATAIFNNCQYQFVGMLKEDDLLAYLELFKNNPLTDTQKSFLLSAKKGNFLLNVDSTDRIKVEITATDNEKHIMGEDVLQ